MTNTFRRVAVLGSGVMGSGIAAHLANAGIPCVMLDMVPPGGPSEDERKRGITEQDKRFRNKFAAGGKEKALKASPALFYTPADAPLVEVGNFDDDMHLLKDCDWIVEVVKEDLGVKRRLFEQVHKHASPTAIVSSNTSGLRIKDMMEPFPEEFRRRFLVTHFFNPVRYMNLLELIPGASTDRDVLARMVSFGRDVLGKGVVLGKDTPNFIGNRIGVYGIMETLRVMMEDGYTVDEVDAVFGPPAGRPKSAVFRTADMVGLDTFIHVADNCYESLVDDERRDAFKVPDFLREMVKRGWLGNKSGQGFYKKQGGEILTLDVRTLEYGPKQKVRSESLGAVKDIEDVSERVRTLCYGEDRLAQLAWKVTSRVLAYSARRVGEIADDIVNIDRAMRWGYAWEQGPFETWDALGVGDAAARMEREGIELDGRVKDMLKGGRSRFYDMEGSRRTYFDFGRGTAMPVEEDQKTIRISTLKAEKRVVKENMGASIIDLGDGILNVEFHTKMNSLDADIVEMLNAAVDLAEKDFLGLVITNDAPQFSVGANLMLVFMEAQQGNWENLDRGVREFQNTNRRLRYARVPVVAA
ncbi:MAG: 3-hydroxyacyl-CoA dehydrogenase NAD-binding domain-containing protein, partial [Myxococcota bacterium]